MVLPILLLLLVAGINAKSVPSSAVNQIERREPSEPRIFFKQVIDASGVFPIELNVPDMISAMMSGMSSMYQSVSSYFGGGGSEGGSEGDQSQQEVSYDPVNFETKPISGRHRRKKVKKTRRKTGTDEDDESMFDLLDFLMF